MDELYGRAMPAAPLARERWITDAQLYARHAEVRGAGGATFTARAWSEIDVVQWLARQPGARGTFTVHRDALGEPTPYGTVADQIARARAAGAAVREDGDTTTVEVQAAITTTLGGLAVDPTARAAENVWAAGHDAGGISTGGYAGGLAAALVMGRIAATSALGELRVGVRPRTELGKGPDPEPNSGPTVKGSVPFIEGTDPLTSGGGLR